jgi:hypothetical protein
MKYCSRISTFRKGVLSEGRTNWAIYVIGWCEDAEERDMHYFRYHISNEA